MMCCSLGAFVMATMPMWRTWLKSTIGYAPAMTTAALAVIAWMFLAQHLTHYLDRAQANDRSLLAEIVAQPICTGAQTTPVASLSRETETTNSISR
jgi:hypothetical protein